MTKIRFLLAAALLVLTVQSFIVPLQAASRAPSVQAAAIARGSPWVGKHLAMLRAEAGKIHDPLLRQATLGILGKPKFAIASRKADEAVIRQRLGKLGLLSAADAPAELIPAHDPLPFVAAPGSTWAGHHSYPGGLVSHELTNLESSLALARNWEKINSIRLDRDLLIAAPIWHDIAKTWTIRWQADGTATRDEGKIAGTNAHHILGVAEAIARGLPPRFVIVLASAHSPPTPGAGLNALLAYLRAACVIAGKPYAAAGLTPEGSSLAKPAPLEAFIDHLSDHDWVGSEVTSLEAQRALAASFPGQSAWQQDRELAAVGDFRVTQVWRELGAAGVIALFKAESAR